MSRRLDTRERWRKLIDRQEGSRLSVVEFCRRAGVSVDRMYAWRRKLAKEATEPPNRSSCSPSFAEVRPTWPTGELDSGDNGGEAVELRLPGRRSILVRRGFDRQTLVALLHVLEAGSPAMPRPEAGR